MADIFISYNKRDRALVERIVPALNAAGLSVWWDDDVTPREEWDLALEREIRAATHVLVLWTANSIQSKWVRAEVLWSHEHQPGKLIQACFGNVPLTISTYLSQSIALDETAPDKSQGWPKLLEWLGKPQPKAAEPPSLPAGPPLWFIGSVWILTLLWALAWVANLTSLNDYNPRLSAGSIFGVRLLILVGNTIGFAGIVGLALFRAWSRYLLAACLVYAVVGTLLLRIDGRAVLMVAGVGGAILGLAFFAGRRGWLR